MIVTMIESGIGYLSETENFKSVVIIRFCYPFYYRCPTLIFSSNPFPKTYFEEKRKLKYLHPKDLESAPTPKSQSRDQKHSNVEYIFDGKRFYMY